MKDEISMARVSDYTVLDNTLTYTLLRINVCPPILLPRRWIRSRPDREFRRQEEGLLLFCSWIVSYRYTPSDKRKILSRAFPSCTLSVLYSTNTSSVLEDEWESADSVEPVHSLTQITAKTGIREPEGKLMTVQDLLRWTGKRNN